MRQQFVWQTVILMVVSILMRTGLRFTPLVVKRLRDCRRDPFRYRKDVLAVVDGEEIRLKDIWPSDEEIDAIVKSSVKTRHVPQSV